MPQLGAGGGVLVHTEPERHLREVAGEPPQQLRVPVDGPVHHPVQGLDERRSPTGPPLVPDGQPADERLEPRRQDGVVVLQRVAVVLVGQVRAGQRRGGAEERLADRARVGRAGPGQRQLLTLGDPQPGQVDRQVRCLQRLEDDFLVDALLVRDRIDNHQDLFVHRLFPRGFWRDQSGARRVLPTSA